jgi:hypothetical protein
VSARSDPIPIDELERRMRPGAFSQRGFLGPAERLEDVLEADARTLLELGLSAGGLADALERLIHAAEASRRRSARVDDRFEVEVEIFTGFQICPWAPSPHSGQCTAGGGVRHASVEWRLRNLDTGERLAGPGLIVHLMRAHSFFEGFESTSRVDPRALARVLGL